MLAEGRIVVFYRFGALTIVALNQGTPRPIIETVKSKVELKVVIPGRICVYIGSYSQSRYKDDSQARRRRLGRGTVFIKGA